MDCYRPAILGRVGLKILLTESYRKIGCCVHAGEFMPTDVVAGSDDGQ